MTSLPIDFVKAFVSPPDTADTKGYVIEMDRYKAEGYGIILGFSKPNACSLNVQGISYKDIKPLLELYFKVSNLFIDDIGLQISEGYVPNGSENSELSINDETI